MNKKVIVLLIILMSVRVNMHLVMGEQSSYSRGVGVEIVEDFEPINPAAPVIKTIFFISFIFQYYNSPRLLLSSSPDQKYFVRHKQAVFSSVSGTFPVQLFEFLSIL